MLTELDDAAYELIEELDTAKDDLLIGDIRQRVDYWNKVMDDGSQVLTDPNSEFRF